MDILLISPAEIMEIAFSASEKVRPDLINDIKIDTAQTKFLKPVLGKLFGRLSDESNTDFVEEYIKPPLAMFVKYLILDDATASIGTMGIITSETEYGNPITDKQLSRLKKRVLNSANCMLNKALEYIIENPELFSEYNAEENIKNRVIMKNGLIL